MTTSLKALIFDVDGTLAETETAHLDAFNSAFAEASLPWRWSRSEYAELLEIAGGAERLRSYIARRGDDLSTGAERDALAARLHRLKNRHYARALAAGEIDLRPGVRRLLAEARARGVRLAIATTATRENVRGLLAQALGADGARWFEVMVTGEDVRAKKPDPEVYVKALLALGLPPSACLALEDSGNGLAAARAAGVAAVVTVSAFTGHHDFEGAALVVDSLGDPGRPCRVLAPTACPVPPVLDLAALERIHERA